MRPLTACLVLLLGLCACAPQAAAPADGDAPVVWRFAIEETAGSVQDAYAQRFKQLIEERAGGRVKVIVYPYGTLGTSDHITEQLYCNTIQFATASPGHLGKLIPEVQVFLLHYALSSDEQVNKHVLQRSEPLRKALRELYAEKDLVYLSAFSEGWMVWTTRKAVRTPADFAGVKMRVMTSPLLLAAYKSYGASPTPMPYSEVYSGLQLRMIDGQVNPIFAIQEMSFYEVTDYLVFPGHAQFFTTVATNPAFLDSLSAADRAMVEQVIDELHDDIFTIQRDFNRERLELIYKKRPKLREQTLRLNAAERAQFAERARAQRAKYVELAGPRGKALLELLDREIAAAARELGEGDAGD